jgi:hypothetical protein
LGAGGVACEVRHVDLTLNENGVQPLTNADAAPSQYGCADWIDAELNALRYGACDGKCINTPGSPFVLEARDGKRPIMAATAGRWAFCSGQVGPADAVGMEFGPGCRIFFLRYDAAGIAVRGTEAAYQADFDIFDPRADGTPPQISLHLTPTHSITFEIAAHRCPERVQLRATDLNLDLARPDEVHGGTGTSVR